MWYAPVQRYSILSRAVQPKVQLTIRVISRVLVIYEPIVEIRFLTSGVACRYAWSVLRLSRLMRLHSRESTYKWHNLPVFSSPMLSRR